MFATRTFYGMPHFHSPLLMPLTQPYGLFPPTIVAVSLAPSAFARLVIPRAQNHWKINKSRIIYSRHCNSLRNQHRTTFLGASTKATQKSVDSSTRIAYQVLSLNFNLPLSHIEICEVRSDSSCFEFRCQQTPTEHLFFLFFACVKCHTRASALPWLPLMGSNHRHPD